MESMIAMKLMAFLETMEYQNDGIHRCHKIHGIHENSGILEKFVHRFHNCMAKFESMVDCHGKHGIFPFPLKNQK
jgi:hypothetical protein